MNRTEPNGWRIADCSTYVFAEETYEKPCTIMNRYAAQKRRTLSLKLSTGMSITTPPQEQFDIPDHQYHQILTLLRTQCQTLFGFVPQYEYGANNFEKLVNFTAYPFAPQFAALKKIEACGTSILSLLRTDPQCIEKLFAFLGVPCAPFLRNQFLAHPDSLYAALVMQQLGFTDRNIINRIVSDRKKYYPAVWGICLSEVKKVSGSVSFSFPKNSTDRFTFSFSDSRAKDFCALFLKEQGELKVCRLLDSYFSSRNATDAGQMFVSLYQNNRISADIKKRIFREGFTDYNHDILVHRNELYLQDIRARSRDGQPKPENKVLTYTKDEEKLDGEQCGYTFHRAQDTDRLLDLSCRMNNCVGYVYRDKALEHRCVIVYAETPGAYEACIELKPETDGAFTMIQCLAPSNRPVSGSLKEACVGWAAERHIDASVITEKQEQTFVRNWMPDARHEEPPAGALPAVKSARINYSNTLYDEVRRNNFSFDSIALLDKNDIRRLIAVLDQNKLACALYGVPKMTAESIYRSLPHWVAARLREDCCFFGPADEKKNESYRQYISTAVKYLFRENEVFYHEADPFNAFFYVFDNTRNGVKNTLARFAAEPDSPAIF